MIRSISTWAIAFSYLVVNLAGTSLQAGSVPVSTVLDRVGQQVESFWNYFPAVTCTEYMTQAKLDAKGKALFERRSSYDYLALLQNTGDQISVDESRVAINHSESKHQAPLLVTDGFSILALVFHPMYQSSYEFTRLPDEAGLLRVAFRHHATLDRSPSVLVLAGHEYPIHWSGVAWIDPATYSVVRVQAGLGTSMTEMGLLRLEADVHYSPQQFAAASAPYWLPDRAIIDAATAHQRWRNTHVFTGYRRFNVQTEVRTAEPK